MPKLSLKKERLAELTTEELHNVAGAAAQTLLDVCYSLGYGCNSVKFCTTAMSCGGGCETQFCQA